MTPFRRLFRWLFAPPQPPVTTWRIVAWWELRRIPYNLILAAFGWLALTIFFVSIYGSGHLQPGEDAVEPFALLLAPIAANICYTAGWLLDAPLRLVRPALSPMLTPRLFGAGLAFSLLVISIPAVLWGGYRLLQLVHVAS